MCLIRKLDSCQHENILPVRLPVEKVTRSLQDLILYFQAPPEWIDHETKQNGLILLKNRQNMFQQEVNIVDFLYKLLLHYTLVLFQCMSSASPFPGGNRFGHRLYWPPTSVQQCSSAQWHCRGREEEHPELLLWATGWEFTNWQHRRRSGTLCGTSICDANTSALTLVQTLRLF